MLISTFLVAEMIFKLPFGNLSDHHGRRRYVMLGFAMSVATALAICFIPMSTFVGCSGAGVHRAVAHASD